MIIFNNCYLYQPVTRVYTPGRPCLPHPTPQLTIPANTKREPRYSAIKGPPLSFWEYKK